MKKYCTNFGKNFDLFDVEMNDREVRNREEKEEES